MKTISGCLTLFALSFLIGNAAAQEGSSPSISKASDALVGTWTAEEFDVPRIPKMQISRDDDQLVIRFWGRGGDDKDTSVSTDALHVLSRYPDSKFEDEETALAFATHKADYGVMYFTLRLHNDVLHMEGVKIVNDSEGDTHRLVNATYTKTGDSPNSKSAVAVDIGEKKMAKAEDKPKPKEPAKRGSIAGRIESGSTLRGRLTLSPVVEKIQPADGIEVGSANPRFSFANVPEGEYTLNFEGTVNGVSKQMTWQGLKVNVGGSETPLSLSMKIPGSN